MATGVIPHTSPSSPEPGATNLDSVDHLGTVSGEQMAAIPEDTRCKNRLQEFAQKNAMPLPIYQTVNHGSSNCPKFKSSVIVDGLVFVSPKAFRRAKAAEQDVAKYALEALTRKIQEEKPPMIKLVPTLYKAILNEFAVKISVPMPTYMTKLAHTDAYQKGQTFISDALFCGKTYTGRGRSKKEAENMAARVIIETILGSSCSKPVMSRILHSKIRLCDPCHQSPAIDEISVISYEDQPQSDPLGEFVHQLSGTLTKKRKNKTKQEESQPKKQQLEEQQESQDIHRKKGQPEEGLDDEEEEDCFIS